MSTPQIPSGLSSLAELDRLSFSYGAGRVDLLFGHGVSLMFENGHHTGVRQGALDAMSDYYETFRDPINFYFPYGARRPHPIGDVDVIAYLQEHMDGLPADETVRLDMDTRFAAELFGFRTKGYRGDATPWLCSFTCNPPHGRWSHWECFLPASWPETAGYDAYIAKILRWCALTRPAHGTAGLSVILDTDVLLTTDGRLPFEALQRHAGLDYPHHGRWCAFVRRKPGDHIRTINWLTVLDDRRVSILGGAESIRQALDEDCPLHPFDGGIVIQAGLRPAIGDVGRNEIPQAYRDVARLTRPLRYEGFTGSNGLLTVPRPLDSVDETLKWLARFD